MNRSGSLIPALHVLVQPAQFVALELRQWIVGIVLLHLVVARGVVCSPEATPGCHTSVLCMDTLQYTLS